MILGLIITDKDGNSKARKCIPLDCGENPDDGFNGYSIYYVSVDSPEGMHAKKTFLRDVSSVIVSNELFNPIDYKEFEYKNFESWHFKRNW
ncbi:MAG: hypothetical protein K9M11_02280 [Candidatus Pacebacteria bacterium]|nr:hypothetical protein [Candidatus Paceibacterota bacterium]